MHPILGRYGPFFLYSFTLVSGLAMAVGIGLTAWKAREVDEADWLDGLIAALLFGIVGGRATFLSARWDYFQQNLSEAWLIWRGGLNYHGIIIAGIVGLWIWCRWQRRPFDAYATLFSPGLAAASAISWLACWLDGCAHGRLAPPGLLSADLPDSYGIFDSRYQTQLLGAGLSLLTLLLILWLQQRGVVVHYFWLTLFGLSIGRLFVTLLRGDDIPVLGQLRWDTLAEGVTALVSLYLLQLKQRRLSVGMRPPDLVDSPVSVEES